MSRSSLMFLILHFFNFFISKKTVLENGPYFFLQKFLVLKKWHRIMKPAREQPTKIPTWVKIHDLPFELWNKECVSRIASTIGHPIHVDQATAKNQNFQVHAFALN